MREPPHTAHDCKFTACRSANNLNGLNRTQLGNTIWRAPLVWLALNLLRFVLIGAFKPLFWLTLHLTWCACLEPLITSSQHEIVPAPPASHVLIDCGSDPE